METNQNAAAVSNKLEVSLDLVNDKMHIIGKAGNLEPIHTDYIPPYGDNLGYMPLQLFLVSLGACAAGSVLVLLRKMQKQVENLHVKASGIRRETHPTSFSSVTLEFHFESANVSTADMEKVIMLSEQSICPVWAMIKGNVEVNPVFTINSGRE